MTHLGSRPPRAGDSGYHGAEMRAIAVVGNPKPASRTLDAALRLAAALGAEPEAIEGMLRDPDQVSSGGVIQS